MKYNTVKKDFLLNKDLLKNFFYSFDLSGQNKIVLDNVLYLTNNRYNEDFPLSVSLRPTKFLNITD